MALYTGKRVKKLVTRLREEYEAAVEGQKKARAALEEENRILKARALRLEDEREAAIHALALSDKEKEKPAEEENERKELLLLAEKCRALSLRLTEKYPDDEETEAFAAFERALSAALGVETEESGFNMDDVLSPKEPLDLGKLCKELGLMEEEG